MANTLTSLIPTLYESLDIVSREMVGFVPAVTRNTSAERAALNQTILVPITQAQTAADNTPAVTPPNTGDQTVGNVLQRHALPPAPERKRTTTWAAFIRNHLALLAGTDFFTAEVLTLRGLVTHYVLFFIHLESRRVVIAGITVHPDKRWMKQMARNVTMEGCGALRDCRYLLHDRDTKYTQSFRAIIASGRVEPLVLPARSPKLNAYALVGEELRDGAALLP